MNPIVSKAGYRLLLSRSASNFPYLIPRADPGRAFHFCIATLLRAAHKCKVSARAEARSRTNVSQSVGPQPLPGTYRLRCPREFSCASTRAAAKVGHALAGRSKPDA